MGQSRLKHAITCRIWVGGVGRGGTGKKRLKYKTEGRIFLKLIIWFYEFWSLFIHSLSDGGGIATAISCHLYHVPALASCRRRPPLHRHFPLAIATDKWWLHRAVISETSTMTDDREEVRRSPSQAVYLGVDRRLAWRTREMELCRTGWIITEFQRDEAFIKNKRTIVML